MTTTLLIIGLLIIAIIAICLWATDRSPNYRDMHESTEEPCQHVVKAGDKRCRRCGMRT